MNRLPSRISRSERERGFTMIELLVVLSIIAILVGIAVPSLLNYRNRAADAVARANLREARPSIEAYFQDNETYVGMTPANLRSTYDASFPQGVTFANLGAVSYCVQSTASGRTWRQNGPNGALEQAAC